MAFKFGEKLNNTDDLSEEIGTEPEEIFVSDFKKEQRRDFDFEREINNIIRNKKIKEFELELETDNLDKIIQFYNSKISSWKEKDGDINFKMTNTAVKLTKYKEERKELPEKLKKRSLLNFFRKRKYEKLSFAVLKLTGDYDLLNNQKEELEKEMKREQEILMYEVSKIANKIRGNCFNLQEEIFSVKELKNQFGTLRENKKENKIPIIELLAINKSYEELAGILQKIELLKDDFYNYNYTENVKRKLKSIIFDAIEPKVKLEEGSRESVITYEIFEKHPKEAVFDMSKMYDDLFFGYFLKNPEDWQNIKNNENIKKIFSGEILKNFEKKVSETIFQFFLNNPNEDYFKPLLFFKNSKIVPYTVMNFWREVKKGGETQMPFIDFKNPGEETIAYKFIASLSHKEIKELESFNIPELMNIINLVLNNPDNFNKVEARGDFKEEVKASGVFKEITQNLKNMEILLLKNLPSIKKDYSFPFLAVIEIDYLENVIFGALHTISTNHYFKNYVNFSKDDYSVLEDLYLKNTNSQNMDIIFERISESEDKNAAESFKKIFKKILDKDHFEKYLSDAENFKKYFRSEGFIKRGNKLIIEILNSMDDIVKENFSLDKINLFFNSLDTLIYLTTESNFADVFKGNFFNEYKSEISNAGCVNFLNQGDIAHEALEKIKEKNWITIQTYNRLYAARRRVIGYESYAFLPKKGESHPTINVTFYGFNFPQDIITYEENYKIYENTIKKHKNKEDLKNNFISWSVEPKNYPEDLNIEKIANFILPIGVAKNGHSHFYATPYGIVSGCVSENPERSGLLKKPYSGRLGVNVTGHKEMLLDFLRKEEKYNLITEESLNRENSEILNAISVKFENLNLFRGLEKMVLPGNIALSEVLINLHIEQYLHNNLIPTPGLLEDLKTGIKENKIQAFLGDKKLGITDIIPGNSKIIFKEI